MNRVVASLVRVGAKVEVVAAVAVEVEMEVEVMAVVTAVLQCSSSGQ